MPKITKTGTRRPSNFTKFLVAYTLIVTAVVLALATRGAAGDATDSIYRRVNRSIVKLELSNKKGGGTGFLVQGAATGKPYLLTNWHICHSTEGFVYASRDGEFSDVRSNILYMKPETDTCITEAVPGDPISIGDVPSKFEMLYVFGHPWLNPLTPVRGRYVGESEERLGIMPNKDGECDAGEKEESILGAVCLIKMQLGNTTIPIFPGNSGSPLLHSDGTLAGLINSSDTRTGNGSFIPLRFIRPLLEAM